MARYEIVARFWDEPVGPPDNYVRHRQGSVIDVPDEHVDRLLQTGSIVPVDADSDADSSGADDSNEAKDTALSEWLDAEAKWRESVEAESKQSAGPPASGDESTESSHAPAGNVQRPKQAAAKSVWVEYAVARGMDRDEAEALEKRDLIAELN